MQTFFDYSGKLLDLDACKPRLNSYDDLPKMLRHVAAHPAFRGFDQNGDVIFVEGFVDCAFCDTTDTREAFASTEPNCLKCPRCGGEDDQSAYPDSRVWDVYYILREKAHADAIKALVKLCDEATEDGYDTVYAEDVARQILAHDALDQ